MAESDAIRKAEEEQKAAIKAAGDNAAAATVSATIGTAGLEGVGVF
jgi:hypothetical protein